MEFKPSYELNLIQDEDFAAAMDDICRRLDDCRVSGYFTGQEDAQIYYEYFPVEQAQAAFEELSHGATAKIKVLVDMRL